MSDLFGGTRLEKLVLGGACLVTFFTAFEVITPVVDFGVANLTTTKLAAVLFFIVMAVWAVKNRAEFFTRRALDLPVLVFVLSNFLSVAAAEDKPSAFKFSLRLVYGALVYLGVSRLPSRTRAHLAVAGTMAATLIIVTVVGLMENYLTFIDWPTLLSPWRQATITFGAFYNERVASTLPYPTILSMYLEMVFPVALAIGIWLFIKQPAAERGRRRWLALAIILGTTAVMAVQLFTYTRTAWVSTPLSLLAGGLMALLFAYGRRVALFFALGAGVLLVLLLASLLFSNKMGVRAGVAKEINYYGAQYTMLSFPASVASGHPYVARVRVKNTSDVAWEPVGNGQVKMSYRWLSYPQKKEHQEASFLMTELPREVRPGQSIDLDVVFKAPADPGRYVMVMELIKGGLGWFSKAYVAPLTVPLDIAQSGSKPLVIPEKNADFELGVAVKTTPSRSQLWRGAIDVWKSSPVLGVGPDQFRLRYEEFMPWVQHDPEVRTHNILLEALANTGVVGLLVMLYLLGAASWSQFKLIRNRSLAPDIRLVALGLLAALIAFVVHGMDDTITWQTGGLFVIFIELGLTSWLAMRAGHTGRGQRSDAG